jgi:hypothetical protein
MLISATSAVAGSSTAMRRIRPRYCARAERLGRRAADERSQLLNRSKRTASLPAQHLKDTESARIGQRVRKQLQIARGCADEHTVVSCLPWLQPPSQNCEAATSQHAIKSRRAGAFAPVAPRRVSPYSRARKRILSLDAEQDGVWIDRHDWLRTRFATASSPDARSRNRERLLPSESDGDRVAATPTRDMSPDQLPRSATRWKIAISLDEMAIQEIPS